MRDRLGPAALVLLTLTGAFGAGLAWMTHMHHRALRYIDPGQMAAFDTGYEQLSDLTVIPVGIVGMICSLVVLWLRPPGVPRWLAGIVLGLQVSIFVARIPLWGKWAEDVRAAGSVRLADGTLHPSYVNYMDTNWIRIAVISGYALLGGVMLLRTTFALRGGSADDALRPIARRGSHLSPG